MTPTQRLFLAVATGQAVANLLPLLHVGAPGDRVCWLWTDASNLAAAKASSELLRRRGFDTEVHPEPLPAELSAVDAWFRHWLPQPPLRSQQRVLVANGGTKVLLLAIAQALEGELSEIVYGEGEPVSVLRLAGGRAESAKRERPAGPPLTLQDVLACTGYGLLEQGRGQKPASLLWRHGQRYAPVAEPEPCYMTAEACDAAYSRGENIGRSFESAVAHRVLAHLDNRQVWHDIVSEIWLGVPVKRPHEDVPAAEWDVLLLLRNGVLLNIECKTGQATQKELDSLWHAMREGSSSLATMWLCSPLPTGLAGRRWFGKLHSHRDRAAWLQRPHLAWTLPGQRPDYWLDGQHFSVPSFEAQLDDLMQPYLPPA